MDPHRGEVPGEAAAEGLEDGFLADPVGEQATVQRAFAVGGPPGRLVVAEHLAAQARRVPERPDPFDVDAGGAVPADRHQGHPLGMGEADPQAGVAGHVRLAEPAFQEADLMGRQFRVRGGHGPQRGVRRGVQRALRGHHVPPAPQLFR
jgi:hypothetical protein